jgi:hypothetical protein
MDIARDRFDYGIVAMSRNLAARGSLMPVRANADELADLSAAAWALAPAHERGVQVLTALE